MVDVVTSSAPAASALVDALLYDDRTRFVDLPYLFGRQYPTITYFLDPGGDADAWTPAETIVINAVFDSIEAVIPVYFERTFNDDALFLEAKQNSDNWDDAGTAGHHEMTEDFDLIDSGGNVEGEFDAQDPYWTGGMTVGGSAFWIMLHEVMHGLGLDHPHADEFSARAFPEVTGPGDRGPFELNQIQFTAMSYVDAWGPAGGTTGGIAGPSAFDIAALQHLYGVNTTYHKDSDVYTLPDADAVIGFNGTSFRTLWDAGGIDEIAYGGAGNTIIDLRPATLQNEPGGGGFRSAADGVNGGFFIANGVTIENARGGSGIDTIQGNDANNTLRGNGGDDTLRGGDGDDDLFGGNDNDTLHGGRHNDILYGEDGNDTLHGEEGDDEMRGGLGNDVYFVTDPGDRVIDVVNATGTFGSGGPIDRLETGNTEPGLGRILIKDSQIDWNVILIRALQGELDHGPLRTDRV